MGQGGASSRASGGFAAALGPGDDPARHAADTLAGGYGLNTAAQLDTFTKRAPDALRRLNAEIGGFADAAGALQGNPAPMHSAARSVQYPHGMAHMMRTLHDGLARVGAQFCDTHRVLDLRFSASGNVAGVWLYDALSGDVCSCEVGAVVLATGGCGQLFPVTSNGPDATGDGYAIALRAGCTLQDMEFIQFTPTAFAAPQALRGHTIVGTLLTVDGVRLLNTEGERFMERYDPARLEGADRATLARAIYREVREGKGTEAGAVYLDATTLSPEAFNRHRPGFYDLCRDHGLDPATEPLQTAPAVHTCLGGVRADHNLCAAPNLFVAGEALAGTHGANRLSSNSLSEANVTGWLAGEQAAACVKTGVNDDGVLNSDAMVLPRAGPQQMSELHRAVQDIMGRAAGVERTAEGIRAGLSELSDIARAHRRAAAKGVDDVGLWLDLRNMLPVAQAILGAALKRRESRGAHYRADYPEEGGEAWRVNVLSALKGSELEHYLEPGV